MGTAIFQTMAGGKNSKDVEKKKKSPLQKRLLKTATVIENKDLKKEEPEAKISTSEDNKKSEKPKFGKKKKEVAKVVVAETAAKTEETTKATKNPTKGKQETVSNN